MEKQLVFADEARRFVQDYLQTHPLPSGTDHAELADMVSQDIGKALVEACTESLKYKGRDLCILAVVGLGIAGFSLTSVGLTALVTTGYASASVYSIRRLKEEMDFLISEVIMPTVRQHYFMAAMRST